MSVSRYRVAAFEALVQGVSQFDPTSREYQEYELRSLRLGAIEYRNYDAATRFVTAVIALYEGGWEKRSALLDFFRKYPLPRVQSYLESDENGQIVTEINPNDPEDMDEILSAHLFHAIKFAITPDRHELVQVVATFAKTHELDTLILLTGDMDILHERFQEGMMSMDDSFVHFYQDIERMTIALLDGEENYYGILCVFLEGKYPADTKLMEHPVCQLSFAMAAIVYGAEPEDIETLLQKMDMADLNPPAADNFGRLLYRFGYEKYAMSALVKGDIRNVETVSMLLELVFTEINSFDDLLEGIRLRPENVSEFPIDLRVIL